MKIVNAIPKGGALHPDWPEGGSFPPPGTIGSLMDGTRYILFEPGDEEIMRRMMPPTDRSSSFSTHIAGDTWTTEDTLGFAGYAYAIVAFLTHEKSKPPLTISIQAPWGGGKTSLMRMIQKQLDPKANLSAERDRSTERTGEDPNSIRDKVKAKVIAAFGRATDGLTLGALKKEIDKRFNNFNAPLPRVSVENAQTQRVTVWFNAWKYESTNQVWAGLADAILQQVPNRLETRSEKETFWLRLNLARINSASIRQHLYNYIIHRVLRTTTGLAWAIAAALVSFVVFQMFGLATAMAIKLGSHFSPPLVSTAASIVVLTLVKPMAAFFKVKKEPVSEVLNELVDVPKYEGELGFVHQVEKDVRQVLACLTPGTTLVIFIDDLDRCSPPKVAAVLEAVNLFLAGDFRECSFVFGMDSEMVAAALQTAHKDLWAALPTEAKVPIGWRFMDKFVQLPFIIPPIKRDIQQLFLDNLIGKFNSESKGSAPDSFDRFRAAVDKAGVFDDNNPEVQRLIRSSIGLFKGNPRELKIFLNVFRFNHLVLYARSERGEPVPSKEALCRWTALSVKWPDHVRWLRRTEPRRVENEAVDFRGSDFPTILEQLEQLAADCTSATDWKARLVKDYGLQDDTSWAEDGLFSLYKVQPGLSIEAGKGFW